MAGAYLEIDPQEAYTFTSNVLLNNAAQELYGYTVWFTAFNREDFSNGSPFLNASTATGQVTIANGSGSTVNSVVTVTLASNYTANLPQVNVGTWVLMGNVAGRNYKFDGGRIAVLPNFSFTYS
jgi:hypothetical protein